MNINADTLQLFFWILFFGFIFYYVIFRAPASDKVYSSESEADVYEARDYLAESGIRTYVKSKSPYRLKSYGGLADPSLHVLDPKDKERAIQLIQNSDRRSSAGDSGRSSRGL